MNMPGFKAEAALYGTGKAYQLVSTNSRIEVRTNRLYMQKPNSQNTPGGSCTGHTSGTTITGTYDSLGRCCTYPPKGFPFCIDCDADKCYDRRTAVLGGFGSGVLQGGVFQGGVFARL
jgi:hypothetical protein